MHSNGNLGRKRWLSLLIAGAGVGIGLTYLFLNRARDRRRDEPSDPSPRRKPHTVDDRGTGQAQAAQILLSLRDCAFEASDEKLAVALGRPAEEVKGWTTGQEIIDDDVVMKARGIALHRGFSIE